jgi:hypothetical protein
MSLDSDGQQVWESDNMAIPASLSPELPSVVVMAKHQEKCDSMAIDHFDSGASRNPILQTEINNSRDESNERVSNKFGWRNN